ncbi:MAG: heme ABC transporter ATP-binding protein [Bradyrhizobiaceae bacterium]|nr:heme ABC transporter ATP-binding protein [Bradyrhizobiaceae bacterium]
MYAARAIRYEVRGRAILDGVDLRLTPGKIVAVVGPNGAGKSTLLKIMAGERRATGGNVLLDDRDLTEWKPADLARRRAVLPQSIEVVFPFLVSEVVALGSSQRVPRSEAAALVSRALSAVDLADFGRRVYGTLSGGEQQRVQFARVLVQAWSGEGAYLLLDEPNASLDLSHQLLILRLARTHAESGGGVLMVLHDLNLAAMVADELIALKDGCRIAAGPPEHVITDQLIAALYGVHASVRGVPDGPFILPQTARLPA